MIDAFVVEGLLAVGGVGLALAVPRRSARVRPAGGPPLKARIGQLRFKLRREVREVVELAREQTARHGEGSVESFTAREMLRSYLPETLAAYLAVPRALRRVRRANGRTPDDDLRAQLRTLRRGLEQLREADAEVGAARMAENGAFLHERFGPPPPPPAERPTSTLLEIAEALFTRVGRI
jgi:hypothetical protein